MTERLFSRSWYRVAELRPRLRHHARIHRHVYRDRPWYILEDVINQTTHRFTPETYEILNRLDGERTVENIWEDLLTQQGDDAPTQDELIALLAQLHGADLLVTDVTPDTRELSERNTQHRVKARKAQWMSPLSIKIPLWDPDSTLEPLARQFAPLMGRAGAALWTSIVVAALLLASIHWSELSAGGIGPLLAPSNLFALWLVFPCVKALHEMGHGIAARRFGAEVHEIGVMLLVFTPVPYVDASGTSALPSKIERAFVAAAGMIVELLVASIALFVWLATEPGLVRSIAFDTFLVASVTTLLFNLNPLLRFDGYYVLADLLEIPNLRQRANDYVAYLVERYGLGVSSATPPLHAEPAERVWLFAFAVSAFVYRLVVMAFIALIVLDFSLVLGTLLLASTAVGWIGRPIYKGVSFLLRSPRLRGRRARSIGVTVAVVALFGIGIGLVPLPHWSRTEGVVWLSDESLVRATTAGFVDSLLIEPGAHVQVGTPLLRCSDDEIQAEVAQLDARVARLEIEERRARQTNASDAQILAERTQHAAKRLARARLRESELVIRSRSEGTLVFPHAGDMPGRYVEQGQLLAYVVSEDRLRIRAIVPESDIDLVRERLQSTEIRLAEHFDTIHEAELLRIAPSATGKLPSAALGAAGGGDIAVEQQGDQQGFSTEPIFEIDFALPEGAGAFGMGGRAHLRFDLGASTLWERGRRQLRQLFLRALDV